MEKVKLYQKSIEIEFDPEKHIYRLNGEKLISVTAITSQIDKSRALIPWAIKLMRLFITEAWDVTKKITEEEKLQIIEDGAKQHRIRKQEAADTGTQAHEWAESWIKGEEPEIPDDERVRNCVISFLKWVKDSGIKLKTSERIVYSKKHNYVGILDADGKIKKDNIIVDFKSSNGIYPEMFFQVSGYWKAAEEESKVEYQRGYIVQFGKDSGEFNVKEISREENEKNFKAFLGALAIKRRLDEIK